MKRFEDIATARGRRFSVAREKPSFLATLKCRPQALLSLVFFAAAFAFFYWAYPHHLHYHEQYQMFLFSAGYVCGVLGVPGGVAELISRFLVQFFLVSAYGALIMAALLTWLQLATWGAMRCNRKALYPLSFIPALLMWMSMCDENTMPTVVIALALTLTAGWLVGKIADMRVRAIVALCLIPVMYVAVGPVAVVLPFAAALPLGLTIGGVVLAAICPVVAQYLFPYPLGRLYYGLHYNRFPQIFPILPWISALSTMVLLSTRYINRLYEKR